MNQTTHSRFRTALRGLVTSLGIGTALAAQCQTLWKSGWPAPSPQGEILTTTWWDPDGSGPRDSILVVGGTFEIPSVGANHLATWDPATKRWGAFALQPNLPVRAVLSLGDGSLAVGGHFTSIGMQPIAHVAIWNGSSWSEPGGGVDGSAYPGPVVNALQTTNNGQLVVGGHFQSAGGQAISGLARWDGTQWHAYSSFTGQVNCLARRPNGNLIVAGAFPPIGFPGFANIAEWNGASWRFYGTGLGGTASYVTSVAVLSTGDVVAGGFFNIAGNLTVPRIARWNGTTWTQLGTGFDGQPRALLPLANGEFLASDVISLNQTPVQGVARWDGSQWIAHAPDLWAGCLTLLPGGELLAAGARPTTTQQLHGLFTWSGHVWSPVAQGFDGTIRKLQPLPNGDLVALGEFTRTPGQDANWAALWNGQAWVSMPPTGGNVPLPRGVVGATTDAGGSLWIATSFRSNGVTYGGVMQRTNTGWQPMGGRPAACLTTYGGQVVYGAAQRSNGPGSVARWSGSQWVDLGAGLDGPVLALLTRRNGELVAGGDFLFSGSTSCSRIARWNGSSWQPFGTGVDGPVRAIAELADGTLVIGGEFVTDGLRPLNLTARWDGSAWQPLGAGLAGGLSAGVHALLALPDGDLLAGGEFRFASGYPANGIARWTGSRWHEVDGGIDGVVLTVAQRADGEVVVGGDFAMARSVDAAHFARLRTSCPATTRRYGAACPGTLGPLDLAPSQHPWLGATFRSTCGSVSATALGLDVFGFTPMHVSLSTLHPNAGAACQLLTGLDAATLRLPTNGTIVSTFSLPNASALLGVQLHQQMLVAELDRAMNLTHLASSNALTLTVGTF